MDRLEWRMKLRIVIYSGLSVEGEQVVGELSVSTTLYDPHTVVLIFVASATVRVYPPVGIGASHISVVPNASQNVTALGIEFISLVSKYQNGWINAGITSGFFLFQAEYQLVCIIT